MHYGTSYFVSKDKADMYYADYGLSPDDVQKKIDSGEIHVGLPPASGQIIVIDNSTRYAIREEYPQRTDYMSGKVTPCSTQHVSSNGSIGFHNSFKEGYIMDITTLAEDLEKVIDAHGLQVVLSTLEEICYGKASHVMENWQDQTLAKAWGRAGKAISKAWKVVGDNGL